MLWLKPIVWFGLATAWTVEKAAVAVTGSGDVADRQPLESLEGPVELFAGRSLDIAFKIPETPAPQQVAVRFSLAEEPEDATDRASFADKIVLAKIRGSNAKVVLPFKHVPDQLLNYPLKASALISGSAGKAVEVKLFDLLVYGDNDETVSPHRTVGLASSLTSKPDIFYEFRQTPHHAKPAFAVVFILAIDVLFVSLILLWKQSIKLSVDLFWRAPARVAVFSLIVLLEAQFVGYFVSWSIFRLLALSAITVPALFIAANRVA